MISGRKVTGWGDKKKYKVPFGKDMGVKNPLVITSKNTRKGGHGGWTRTGKLSSKWVEVKIDEDKHCKKDRRHGAKESVAVLVFSKPFVMSVGLSGIDKAKCCSSIYIYIYRYI